MPESGEFFQGSTQRSHVPAFQVYLQEFLALLILQTIDLWPLFLIGGDHLFVELLFSHLGQFPIGRRSVRAEAEGPKKGVARLLDDAPFEHHRDG